MSTTPSERRALLFLAGVACLGVGVRATAAVRREPPRAEQRAALARQLEAVDSARAAGRGKRRVGGRGSGVATSAAPRSRPGRHANQRDAGVAQPRPATPHPPPAVVLGVVDVDVASASELEALPGVGPALAARIVADRDSLGPFGSAGALEGVRGVGPALIRKLQGRVTFSGTPRLPHDVRPRSEAGRATPSAAHPSPPDRSRRRSRRR